MRKKIDKPLIGLGVVGIIGGVAIYSYFGVEIFCLAALFWLLICYLWQHSMNRGSPWYEKMIAVFIEALLWAITAFAWYLLGYGLSWLMGWNSPLVICVIEGAVLHLIGWQLYDFGLLNRWWFSLNQYLFYLAVSLGSTVIIMAILKSLMH